MGICESHQAPQQLKIMPPNYVNLNCQFPFSYAEAFAVFQGSNHLFPQERTYQVLMLDTTRQKSKENRESKQSNKPFSDVKHFHMGRGLCKICFRMEMTELQEAIRIQFSSQKNRTSFKSCKACQGAMAAYLTTVAR